MNKQLDYSRIQVLMDKVSEFVATLPSEMDDKNGFEFLVFAHDVENKVSGSYVCINGDDEIESIISCIDQCISGAAIKGKKANPQEWNILSAIVEYIIRFCAMYPALYESFKEKVEHYKKK